MAPRRALLLLFSLARVRARDCGQEELDARDVTGCVTLTHMKFLGHRGAIWLAEALHNHSDLEILDLHHTRIGDDDAHALAEGLKNNDKLKRLALHNNKIRNAGAAALGAALAENSALEFLSLSSNGVGDEGLQGIAQGLRDNHALRRLDLYFNLVGDAGAAALGDVLSPASGLRMIHLDSNHIGDVGAASLAKALERGAPVGELGLSYNRLTPKGADAIVAAAQASAVHSFTIAHNQLAEGSEGAAKAKALAPELQARGALARWLVDATLADFMGSEGPPMLSPFAAPVRALQAHTTGGLLALRHLDATGIAAHEALRPLDAAQREQLAAVLYQKVSEAVAASHDEL